MKIVVLDGLTLNPGDNPWDALAELGELTVYPHTPDDAIVARCQGAEVVLTNKTPLTANTLAKLTDLRFIAVLATGTNVVDLVAARSAGIPVSNVPAYGTDAVAQHTLALLLALCHRVEAHDADVRSGAWARSGQFCYWRTPPLELAGLTLGIIGFGRIGRRVAQLGDALGMLVIASGGRSRGEPEGVRTFGWRSSAEVFVEADVITLHCPLTASNRHMVNATSLATVKESALLINTARGALVDEVALADALRRGALRGAGLDVVEEEPMAPGNPLLEAPRCLITPHMAWGSLAARRRLMQTAVDNVRAFCAGSPVNVVV